MDAICLHINLLAFLHLKCIKFPFPGIYTFSLWGITCHIQSYSVLDSEQSHWPHSLGSFLPSQSGTLLSLDLLPPSSSPSQHFTVLFLTRNPPFSHRGASIPARPPASSPPSPLLHTSSVSGCRAIHQCGGAEKSSLSCINTTSHRQPPAAVMDGGRTQNRGGILPEADDRAAPEQMITSAPQKPRRNPPWDPPGSVFRRHTCSFFFPFDVMESSKLNAVTGETDTHKSY